MKTTSSEKKVIRDYYQHGVGTRRVRITTDGRVMITGKPTVDQQPKWVFGGYVEDVIRMQKNDKDTSIRQHLHGLMCESG